MRLLIVEDELDLANNLKKGLTEAGFVVDIAADGEQGLFLIETEPYDLVLLDLMLPKMDGIQVCRTAREHSIKTPIIMLTAKSNIENKIEGLNLGADDYVTKPFSFHELLARIKALLRRPQTLEKPLFEMDTLKIDFHRHEVCRHEEKINLTPKEYSVLEMLALNKSGVVTRSMLIEHVWDYNYEGNSNIVDVIIGTLRKKIDRSGELKLIHTIYGVGFKLAVEE